MQNVNHQTWTEYSRIKIPRCSGQCHIFSRLICECFCSVYAVFL